MRNSSEAAEDLVRRLITSTNCSHAGSMWTYELTSEVENIEVVSEHEPVTHTLRIHPCWLRYVVDQGEFQCCIADEIEAWYKLEDLMAEESYFIVA